MARLFIYLCFFVLWPGMTWALATTMEFGVRGGMDAKLVEENYAIAELYYQQRLPWEREVSPGVVVSVRLDAGASYLEAASDKGGWLAVGGEVVLGLMDGFWEIEAGWRPTIMFDYKLGNDHLGGPIQFSTHAGTSFNLGDVSLSYRYQHISNADLYDKNPGLDVHMFGVGMRF